MRKQEFNSKLISLLPLDEVPVHVPLRRPRPLRFERLRVGGEGKTDANLTNFLSTCCASASTTSLSRPAQASLALRPARLLTHHVCFVTRLRSNRLPGQIARQLPCQPTTTWVAPSSTGDLRRWGALSYSNSLQFREAGSLITRPATVSHHAPCLASPHRHHRFSAASVHDDRTLYSQSGPAT